VALLYDPVEFEVHQNPIFDATLNDYLRGMVIQLLDIDIPDTMPPQPMPDALSPMTQYTQFLYQAPTPQAANGMDTHSFPPEDYAMGYEHSAFPFPSAIPPLTSSSTVWVRGLGAGLMGADSSRGRGRGRSPSPPPSNPLGRGRGRVPSTHNQYPYQTSMELPLSSCWSFSFFLSLSSKPLTINFTFPQTLGSTTTLHRQTILLAGF